MIRVGKLDAAEAEIARLTAENERLRAEVREWLCSKCRTVFPGPPQVGFHCVICPRCGGNTAPRGTVELKEARRNVTRLTVELSEAQYDKDELREALRMYGRHLFSCRTLSPLNSVKCTCGWDEAHAVLGGDR